jgi:flagellar hook-length control protein FliK
MNVNVLSTPANGPPSPAKVETNKMSKPEEKSFGKTLENTIQDQAESQTEEKPKSTEDISNAVAVITPTNVPVNILAPVILDGQQVQVDLLEGENTNTEDLAMPVSYDAQAISTASMLTEQPEIPDLAPTIPETVQIEVVTTGAQASVDILKNQEVGVFIQGVGETVSLANQQNEINSLGADALDESQSEDIISQMPDLEKINTTDDDAVINMQGLPSLVSAKLAAADIVENKIALPLQQVVHAVKNMVESTQQTLQIRLHPENLGNIQVRLVSTADGIQVFMNAEKPSTSQLLETNLNQLQDILLQSGIKLGGMMVGNPQQDMQNNLFGWQSNSFQSNFRASTSEEKAKGFETRDAVAMTTSALDFRA